MNQKNLLKTLRHGGPNRRQLLQIRGCEVAAGRGRGQAFRENLDHAQHPRRAHHWRGHQFLDLVRAVVVAFADHLLMAVQFHGFEVLVCFAWAKLLITSARRPLAVRAATDPVVFSGMLPILCSFAGYMNTRFCFSTRIMPTSCACT